MNCQQVHEKIEAYHQGALPEADERGVDIHLVQCPMCNEVLTEVDTLIETCRSALATSAVSPDTTQLRGGIESIEQHAAEQVTKRGRFNRNDAMMRLSFALVVIPAIWVFGLAVMHTYAVVADWEPTPATTINIVDTDFDLPGTPAIKR